MATKNYGNPGVVIHEIDAGSTITGVLPNGTELNEKKGRIKRFQECTDGGLFPAPELWGMALSQVSISLPGVTLIQIAIKDQDGILHTIYDSSLSTELPVDNFVWTPRSCYLIPSDSLVIKATGITSSKGKIRIWQAAGWSLTPFSLVNL